MMMSVEHLVEWELAGETEVLWRNLPQCHSVHHKSHVLTWHRTQATAVEGRRLTAWAIARPTYQVTLLPVPPLCVLIQTAISQVFRAELHNTRWRLLSTSRANAAMQTQTFLNLTLNAYGKWGGWIFNCRIITDINRSYIIYIYIHMSSEFCFECSFTEIHRVLSKTLILY
jgi:hypothetical protein